MTWASEGLLSLLEGREWGEGGRETADETQREGRTEVVGREAESTKQRQPEGGRGEPNTLRWTDTRKGMSPLQTADLWCPWGLGNPTERKREAHICCPDVSGPCCPLSPKGHRPACGSWRRWGPGFIGTQVQIPSWPLTRQVASGK